MTSFSDLNLDPKVLKAIEATGYTTPTPIQEGAIRPALEGRDVLGIAQTGTGKTAAFTLPMITRLGKGRARARMPRSLVLAPTRELAAQVAENFDQYAKGSRLKKALLIGGVSFKEQDQLIDRGVDVLIATPGRLIDHFERGKLLLTGVEIMVVDEADRMLDMGFIPDIERIFEMTPFTRQTLFFSATMAPEIERITNTFLSNPVKIEVARQNTTSDTITQILIEHTPKNKHYAAKDKRAILRSIIERDGEACRNAIIFCNRKTEVDVVAKSMKKHGLNAEPIHGDLDQSQRTRTLDAFRDGSLRFLVASDVAARGLDIPNVSHVFNFDVPSHAEDYVHRIGRTGRAGKLGTAYTLYTPSDEKYLDAIERLIEKPIPRGENPWQAPGGKADEAAPEAEAEDKPRKSRSRSRSKAKPAEETPVEAPPQAEEQAPSREADRRPRRGGRGRDRDDRGPRVVGLGDHVPSFIEMSFEERMAETA
ncbi:DEAD/DEAH box helicase [Jannaschia seohaensis]|uniref:DEAD-box ATP-dependent RNA helicase RhpA n=1 Tax=Jannaschia seohaensis TaxID=475081 RepID=A0A2Y9C7T0_9RHOB|nr:DEAD/DEAH box helicase [Jannaschia seohaensis]PWJ18138.1 ATP-dependent RNA helicase RhlE [Jannaschia seohaensis]SSA46663.1 ATP-dependent RNA helicase RhlE [Jannaschia seohaensis]